MNIINLNVERIIIHQIYRRDHDGQKKTPGQSTELLRFDERAMRTFKNRFVNAIGEDSKAVEMTIVNQSDTDLPAIINELSTSNEENYIAKSFDVANKLADAQNRRNFPGGIIVVFSGKHGANSNKFVGIIKADIHSAYEKITNSNTREISLKFVEEALLTPASKLYKTAAFFEKSSPEASEDLNDKWSVLVADSQISQTDGKAAAQYFYSNFLGCGYPNTSARITKQFYNATCEFVRDLDISEENRIDIYNSLTSYLKVENTDVISPMEFGERYFELDTRDTYRNFLLEKELPTTSFTKDTSHIESKLKMRKLSFSKNVKITAPFSNFRELINVTAITEDGDGNPVDWTNVLIKDKIVSHE